MNKHMGHKRVDDHEKMRRLLHRSPELTLLQEHQVRNYNRRQTLRYNNGMIGNHLRRKRPHRHKKLLKRRQQIGAPVSGASTPRRGDSKAEASQVGRQSARPKIAGRGSIGQEFSGQSQMEDVPDQDGEIYEEVREETVLVDLDHIPGSRGGSLPVRTTRSVSVNPETRGIRRTSSGNDDA